MHPAPAPAPSRTVAPAPAPAPSCPGPGCQGRSAASAGCADGQFVAGNDITASTGAVAGTVKVFWSARCSSAYSSLQIAGATPLRARLQFYEDGALVQDENSLTAPDDYFQTVMAYLEPGDCVLATGLLGHSRDDGYYDPATTPRYCRR